MVLNYCLFFHLMQKVFILIWLLGFPTVISVAQSQDPYGQTRLAYMDLRFQDGNALLARHYPTESTENIGLSAFREFLTALLWQSGNANTRFLLKAEYWGKRLNAMKVKSPASLTACVELNIYRAVLTSQFYDFRESASALMQAYRDLTKHRAEMGEVQWNRLSGIMGVLFSQVPDQAWKYLKLAGIRPDGLRGFDGLREYFSLASPGSADQLEGYLLLITAYKEFSTDPGAAWKFAEAQTDRFSMNPLVRYQNALAALKAGKNGQAINLLTPAAATVPPFPTWDYQLGRCYLHALDSRAALYLERFLKNNGTETYLHAGYLRLGWHYWLNGDAESAGRCFAAIGSLPEARSVYDKQAVREIHEQPRPDGELLKLRLLFDGGDFERCLTACNSLERSGVLSVASIGELNYRRARSYQRLNRRDEAILAFESVISRKEDVKSYLLPNSALQIGYIYKEKGQKDLARKYFQLSLDLNNYGYRDGINRQAQTAMRELE
ncbi:MAG: hypothetical protein A2X22_08995 [Bacteroidetes bacterium GWF2_49_14]|nr:MAG: hypothetical protein A2X22_08995 [Bacteroidetes bacterium GWF2_49_14]HBB93426.1 hypothetical protein [Bacteroidales bacterium]